LGTVLGGSIVIEAVFSWPGLGQVLLDSVMSRNYPLILGILVLSALLVIVINIIVDVTYSRLDPRVRSNA
ncbi:ABC transporter permease subunit, partial [Atlantibacter subterraneus]